MFNEQVPYSTLAAQAPHLRGKSLHVERSHIALQYRAPVIAFGIGESHLRFVEVHDKTNAHFPAGDALAARDGHRVGAMRIGTRVPRGAGRCRVGAFFGCALRQNKSLGRPT